MTAHFAREADMAMANRSHEVEPAGKPEHAQPLINKATEYDLLPYPSMPMAYTQPARLAALATLFGIASPPADRARVLELGCAAGGNIIPLAARFPQASFLGIDLSQRHIDDGRERIVALGLRNVRLLQADLTTLDLDREEFDYIICHGVFSWVPKAAQDAIFRLCQSSLAANGLVTISYNVLPGWHLRTAIRDLCLRHAGNVGTPQRRVARARAALARIAEVSDRTQPYGMLLQTEAARLKDVPAAYILGEFLAPDNAPCYVQDFIGRAAACQLDYLCEADLFAAVPPALDATIRNRITAFTDANRSATEQDIDFLTGRLFRRSVLVPQRPLGGKPPIPKPDHLKTLHVSSPLRRDAAASTETSVVFTDDQARPVTVRDSAISQTITRLGEAYPGTLSVDELIQGGADAGTATAERVGRTVFALVMAGRADLSTLPLAVASWDQQRPKAWPLACTEAAAGQAWITTLRHTGVPALPILRFLLPCLDGRRDHAALREALIAALRSGAVPMPELVSGQPPPPLDADARIADQYLGQILRYLSHQALLQPV